MARCLVCGTNHAACGQRTTVVPVDERTTEGELGMDVKRYEVDFDLGNGRTARTTLKLSDAEAKRRGLLADDEKPKTVAKKRTPANKARGSQNKSN